MENEQQYYIYTYTIPYANFLFGWTPDNYPYLKIYRVAGAYFTDTGFGSFKYGNRVVTEDLVIEISEKIIHGDSPFNQDGQHNPIEITVVCSERNPRSNQ